MDAGKNYDREPIFILCITKLYFHNTHIYPHAIKEGVHSLDIIYIYYRNWLTRHAFYMIIFHFTKYIQDKKKINK